MSLDPCWQHNYRLLVDCAMGRSPADLVIKNGRWVCVQTGEIIPGTHIAVKQGRIAFVGSDAGHTVGPQTQMIDAHDRYLVPGLLDGHVHIESGMLTVTEFVRAVLPHGTTGMFIDPHEIANVLGLRGVRLMVDEAGLQPMHVFVQVPSCVPSAPGLETPGGTLGLAEVAEALTWPGIIGLGEVMNFPGVAAGDEKMHKEMALARCARKLVSGHYASPDLGLPFHGYAAGGATDDHEGTRKEDAVIRGRQGMWVMMRYGSAWQDVAEQVRAVTEMHMDPRHFLLCTDDAHAATLAGEGHMDRVVRHAIEQHMPPMTAIQMATINTAEYFGLGREIGSIAPGRHADILIVSDLESFEVDAVIAKGRLASEAGRILVQMPEMAYPAWARQSVHLNRPVTAQDFVLKAPPGKNSATANVIGINENQAPTILIRKVVKVVDGCVGIDLSQDLAKAAVVERHHGSGRIQVGLVHGFGFNVPCAVATSVAHDSHHIIVVGTDEQNMADAVNALAQLGGGQVVIRQGQLIGKVALPIAGLMSSQPAEEVAKEAESVLVGLRACGCLLNNANMQLSLLGLVVIPQLRISDLGLVDVTSFSIIPVLE